MKIKKILPIAVGVALLAALTGCTSGGSSTSSADSGKKVTVNWWTWDPNQAAAYSQCIPAFEKANPDITVKISQYNVSAYFTKLTAGFVSGDAPDAFMNSVTYLQSYAGQNQLMPLDKFIDQDHFNMKKYSIGVSAWKYTNGKQYALPMDWSTGVLYYNKALLAKAGYTAKDIDDLTWNPTNGGSLWTMIKHLTVDKNGVRGDQAGFNPADVATYGIGNLESTGDPFGQNDWGWLLPNDGINIPNKNEWASVFDYANPKVEQSVQLVRTLTNDGYSPQLNQFTTADTQQLGSGDVAIYLGGTWEASTFAAVPGIKVGMAPLPEGTNTGKRALMSNSNGNVMWAGTKNPEQTWKWMSYQESQACQTKAADYNGSFIPSIAAATNSLAKAEAAKGVDFSVINNYVKDNELFSSPVYNNGATLTTAMVPQFEAYFTNKANNSIFPKMQAQSKTLLAQK